MLHSLVRTSMGERRHSREGPPSHDGEPPPIASPPRPQYLLEDDEADAYTIYSVNTQHYAQQRSIYPTLREDNETLFGLLPAEPHELSLLTSSRIGIRPSPSTMALCRISTLMADDTAKGITCPMMRKSRPVCRCSMLYTTTCSASV